jgi:hypothetical protein
MKTVLFLTTLWMAVPGSALAQTAPTTAQLKPPIAAPCVMVSLGEPTPPGTPVFACAVLDPSVILTTVGTVTTIKAVVSAVVVPQFVNGELYTSTGAVPTYPLTNTPIAGTVQAYRNGIRQALGIDFTVSGSVVTFLATLPGQTIPQAGDLVSFDYHR